VAIEIRFTSAGVPRAGITKNTGGNPADSRNAVNKPGGAKSDICAGNGTRAGAKSIPLGGMPE